MLKVLVTAAFIFAGAQVLAHEGHEHGGGKGEGACKALKEACKKAGYEKGKHKDGKGLIVDCMGKVAKGETVEGLSFDTAAPENKACIDHLAMKKDHMMNKMDKMAEKHEANAEKREAKKAAKEAGKAADEGHSH